MGRYSETMSYQVLARKWRPQNFQQLVGQTHVAQTLANSLQRKQLHHAYLFTGTRGIGKTTIARIFAKCLNCTSGITAEPCGSCAHCLAISEGNFLDLIEVDAASRTKVEDTRALLDNVPYAPHQGRFKIYLIDEVHMLSAHSFNALLKTLEEPPEHVKFLLATTDPQKLPITILSRCLQFTLKKLQPQQIAAHLQTILDKEQYSYEQPALQLLAVAADGSVRDSLSLLDQAIAYSAGQVTEAAVHSMLGSMDQAQILPLLQAIAVEDAATAIEHLQHLDTLGADFDYVLVELLRLIQQIALLQTAPQSVPADTPCFSELKELANTVAKETTQLYYQIALIGRRDLSYAPDSKTGLEMIVLRMLAFQPTKSVAVTTPPSLDIPTSSTAVNSQIAEPAARPKNIYTPTTTTMAPTPPPPSFAAKTNAVKNNSQATRTTTSPDNISSPATTTRAPTPPPASFAAETRTTTDNSQTTSSREKITSVAATQKILPDWAEIVSQLQLKGIALALVKHCSITEFTENNIRLQLEPNQAPLLNKKIEERVAQALSKHFTNKIKVSIEIGSSKLETPAYQEQQQKQAEQNVAIAALEKDQTIQKIRSTFSATIVPGSIKPKVTTNK